MPQTKQVAEICAAVVTHSDIRERILPWHKDGLGICKIIILIDSSYLVKGISEHVWKWKRTDYRNAKKQPVVNVDLFKQPDELLLEFEQNNIPVWLWHIRRELNHEADTLANETLDE